LVLVDCSRYEERLIGRKTRILVSSIRVFLHIRGSERAATHQQYSRGRPSDPQIPATRRPAV